ncbi:MAG: hypothetical protein WHS64_06955 [Fervidobacterium sp.]|uniref:Uncharacterized protein n=1 Tax=Fervidobacterium gondwanense DSM 13020 TaxID=1121883 RepID=A0A1M7T5K5_FERGO|nr:hypothetical protein [Fervidobacterium gondwanense]UXF00705.1 hypothetical protein IB67_03820 [Fervidobacterium riparium]SHN66004.1 hypothetical protein SAMN02745226_01573 [Fervidobacterium gondwanense DSM 13020]
MNFVPWIISFSAVFVDNVFRDYFSITPLYFLFESVVEEKPTLKIARLLIFSVSYQSFAAMNLSLIWVAITFFIIMIELYRDNFYYPWSASLLQAVIFLLPYYYLYPFSYVYGYIVNVILFVYAYRKLELGGAR